MNTETILKSWKQKKFKPVYWFQGEEDYYIDQLIQFAEHEILPKSEADFNLTVFYGRDVDWAAVLNACRRYPMFAEKQVVILKEAQHLKEVEKLEAYINAPLETTIFIVAYKGKMLDKRTKLFKLLQSHAEVFNSEKIKDYKMHEWIADLVKSKGFSSNSKCIAMLEEHIGNDLSRIANEIDKLSLNLTGKKVIEEDDIEKFIGISKEYNVFELQEAISRKDLVKAIKIINYFESNPKAVPIQQALPALYTFISKTYTAFGMSDQSDFALKPLFYNNVNAFQQGKLMMKNYGYSGVEKLLLLLHQYNLKGIGIGDSGTTGPTLMKEMVTKMMI
ncbi:MAG TPA: DNA polymerase III subunit delta [Ferruginibacter sp.]|nr:DNA polymerase III subunit delta [Ferruginibacter sp.]HRE63379.1 DNA polymerase III subunit delta [Ferruginibacter sp.]